MDAVIDPERAPVARSMDDFLFETIDLSRTLDTKKWARFYDAIPVDPYVSEGYRYKAIAWLRIKHARAAANRSIDERIARANDASGIDAVRSRAMQSDGTPTWVSRETGYACWKLPQYALAQSKLYNPVHGDLRREYPPVARDVLEESDFQRLWLHYSTRFGWGDAIVLVQFQRVDCRPGRVGRAAIEGFHQDGNPHVAMLVVDRTNLSADSGVSQYKLDDHGRMTDTMVLDEVIAPGNVIHWNDKRVWHYGTDLVVADANANGGRGTRDVVIMSAKQPPAHVPMASVPERFRDAT
jgi:hypothetical protein